MDWCLSTHTYAGQVLLRYIRGRRLDGIPVLVFCADGLNSTTYVDNYTLAGSRTSTRAVRRYIHSLGDGMSDDYLEWAKFRAC